MDTTLDQPLDSANHQIEQALRRSQVRITDTLALGVERYFLERGQSLDKPRELRDTVVSGLALRREPSGKKVWHYGYSLDGRRGRVKVGNFPALGVEGARKATKAIAGKVALGIDPAAERRKARGAAEEERRRRNRVLGVFIETDYKLWAEAHLRSHRQTLAALKADFGDAKESPEQKRGAGWWTRRMDSLTVEDIDTWRTGELRRGIKATTINRAWQRLRAMLGKAYDWKVIEDPPLRVKKLKTDRRGRVRYLSAAERSRLFEALARREQMRRERRARLNAWRTARHRSLLRTYGDGEYTDYLEPITRTWLGSGLRKTEALSLKWINLDFDFDLITVPGDVAKNRQTRAVPMTADVKATLLRWRAQQKILSPDGLVFTFRGRRIRNVRTAWKGLMKLAEITNYRVHDNRHDFASRLAMAGVSLQTIAGLLGHEDLTQVQRYAHLSPQHLQEAVRKLDPPAEGTTQGTVAGPAELSGKQIEAALAIAA